MMEPIDLMRCETGDFFRGDPDSEKWRGEAVTWWKAVTRADFDAREARLARAEQERDAATARANTNAVGAELMRARADKAEKDRDDAYRAAMKAAEDFANATGRVSQSNLDLRGLLREAAPYIKRAPFDIVARIDDALNRMGGDGAIEGGRE